MDSESFASAVHPVLGLLALNLKHPYRGMHPPCTHQPVLWDLGGPPPLGHLGALNLKHPYRGFGLLARGGVFLLGYINYPVNSVISRNNCIHLFVIN